MSPYDLSFRWIRDITWEILGKGVYPSWPGAHESDFGKEFSDLSSFSIEIRALKNFGKYLIATDDLIATIDLYTNGWHLDDCNFMSWWWGKEEAPQEDFTAALVAMLLREPQARRSSDLMRAAGIDTSKQIWTDDWHGDFHLPKDWRKIIGLECRYSITGEEK
jgi:hypothetical protein